MIGLESARRFAETGQPKGSVTVSEFFDFLAANDGDLLVQSYRVRYEVFCLERGFPIAARVAEQQESDEFDGRSIHMLARHRNGQTAGTIRLVLHSNLGFPSQSHCVFDDAYAYLRDANSSELKTYGEISRLAISKVFRRRADDTIYGGNPRNGRDRSRGVPREGPAVSRPAPGPEILTGLYKCVYQESKRLGITHWLIAAERSLDVIIRRMGWPFTPVGPEVDYYGPVRPYLASVSNCDAVLSRKNPELLAYLMDGLVLPSMDGYPSLAEPAMAVMAT